MTWRTVGPVILRQGWKHAIKVDQFKIPCLDYPLRPTVNFKIPFIFLMDFEIPGF